jgi:ATP-dependent Lon protease
MLELSNKNIYNLYILINKYKMIKKILLLVLNIMNINTENLINLNIKRQINNEIFNKSCLDAINQLKIQYVNQLKIKGCALNKFLINLSDNINHSIICLNNDNELKCKLKNNFRLKLISESNILKSIIDDIYNYSIINHDCKFSKCINIYKTKLLEMFESPKKKIKKNIKEDEDYNEGDDDEEDEEYNEYNYHYDESSGESSDDEQEIINKTTRKIVNEGKEFIQQIFNFQNEEPKTEIINYFTKLSNNQRKDVLYNVKQINNYHQMNEPLLFQILNTPVSLCQKNIMLKTYTGLILSRTPEKKLKTWFEALMTIPFGKFKGINLKEIKSKKVKNFLDNLQTVMDQAVYGHDEAKRHILQMMGQQVRNPNSKGNMLGIWGPPGNGKTTIIKEGIAKAMDKPFIFISLGGATDSSFLEGHSYTYEGSIYGRIADGLITSKCMDPIIYFDELDKISKTPKGDEISNILVHLTDPVQNTHFRDKYFHGIDIDLSKATMIFSFNDPHNVNPILLDRITMIETKYLLLSQKIYIAQNHLLPNMIKEMGMKPGDIIINNETITFLIDNWTHEGGVRKLKSILYSLIREVNIANLTKVTICNQNVILPFKITIENVKILLKHKREITPEKIHKLDTCGVINGLYASSDGSHGGIIPIQILWFPSTIPLDVKATGNLQQVIKESTQVAASLAFNRLSSELQEKYLLAWKERPKGIHIHCPEGATPKDGPSAGTALTVAIYSMLTGKKIRHDIAITGEINLQGNVTAIGGLDNKLEGAKKAGVKFILYPKENEKDIIQIKERNPDLIDDNLIVQAIETIDEALLYSLI